VKSRLVGGRESRRFRGSRSRVLDADDGHRTAGVEHSCELRKDEMNAATLKLFALAEIVEKVIGKTLPSYPWSGEAKSLSRDLKNLSLEELLQVSSATDDLAVMADRIEQTLEKIGNPRGSEDARGGSQQDCSSQSRNSRPLVARCTSVLRR
jgi:hypothetical protein